MVAFAIGVLAVDHFGLLRVEHQTALGEPSIQDLTQGQGLALAPTVADDVVGVPLERHAGNHPLQPDIAHIVQEQVRQERADNPSLRRAPFPRHKRAVQHRRRLQPTLDVEQHPRAIGNQLSRRVWDGYDDIVQKGCAAWNRPDVAEARQCWKADQATLDPKKLDFVDDTGADTKMVRAYGRAPSGHRLIGKQPTEAKGAKLLLLPPARLSRRPTWCYSPDLNPIELAFAKLKTSLRKAADRTLDTLWERIRLILEDFTPTCRSGFLLLTYAFFPSLVRILICSA